MNKITLAAILALVLLAVAAEREHLAARASIDEMNRMATEMQTQPFPPVLPPLVWPPPDGAKPPHVHVCDPHDCPFLPVVTVPMHSGEDLP